MMEDLNLPKTVQEYFELNGPNQVFTHPYTPQENGHIESFLSILSASIDKEYFDILELENRLQRFYYMYNNKRTHTGTKGLPPAIFNKAWHNDLVMTFQEEKKKVIIKAEISIYEIPGILSQREHLAKNKSRKALRFKKTKAEKLLPPPTTLQHRFTHRRQSHLAM
ncbi:MAG: transposase [Bacteroidetes bacterium]|nr:transposase [Bacteroidota bacterium]